MPVVFALMVFVSTLVAAATAHAVTFTPDAPGVNGFTAVDKVVWKDSKGLDREFHFAKVYPNPKVPQIMGYVTRMVWQPDAASPRIIAEEDPSGVNHSNAQGWGINVMHMHFSQNEGYNPYFPTERFGATTTKRDGFDFVQTPTFAGEHHLIFTVKYKQYTTLIVGDVDNRKSVDVIIDWVFIDGHDAVEYAFTIDATREYVADGDPFRSDTRAPFSVVSSASWKNTYDWAGGSGAPDGQSFGDMKTFVTGDMRNWTYGGQNSIPFIWQWVSPASGRGDAEGAYVQTETYTQKQAGSGFNNGQDGSGNRMPVFGDGQVQGSLFAYQMNYYDNYASKRMTWGSHFGSIDGGYGSSPGYQNYTVSMHIGKYSDHGVPAMIAENESLHNGTTSLVAVSGALVTEGNEGSGNPTQKTYSPAGYNHVHRTFEAIAHNQQSKLAFDLGEGEFRNPVFVVHGFSGAAATAGVILNGAELVAGSDYLASVDAANEKLYVTLLRTLSGDNLITLGALATPPPPPPPAPDRDNDGVPDATDNCPDAANAAQTDSNGNGVGDACEPPPPPASSDPITTILRGVLRLLGGR